MFEPNRPHETSVAPPSLPEPGKVDLAKWDVDDDDDGPGGGGNAGGPAGGDGGQPPGGGSLPGSSVSGLDSPYDMGTASADGNFKRGATKPIMIVGGLLGWWFLRGAQTRTRRTRALSPFLLLCYPSSAIVARLATSEACIN